MDSNKKSILMILKQLIQEHQLIKASILKLHIF